MALPRGFWQRPLPELAREWPADYANCAKGYIRIKRDGVEYLHRLIWAHFNGPIPEGMQIDHINGNRTDCRLENLRCVTPALNGRNLHMRKANRSGVTGVHRTTSGGRTYWSASWYSADGRHHGRSFNVVKYGEEQARQLAIEYRAARIAEVGDYTERHGNAPANTGARGTASPR